VVNEDRQNEQALLSLVISVNAQDKCGSPQDENDNCHQSKSRFHLLICSLADVVAVLEWRNSDRLPSGFDWRAEPNIHSQSRLVAVQRKLHVDPSASCGSFPAPTPTFRDSPVRWFATQAFAGAKSDATIVWSTDTSVPVPSTGHSVLRRARTGQM
jgi:hypothetical protein